MNLKFILWRIKMGKKSNHLYIDEPLSNFFENSKILNADSATGKRLGRDQFIFLAAYGYYLGLKYPFKKSTNLGKDLIVMNQFDEEQLAILYAIAISDTGDAQVILDDVKVGNIAMEYANAGLSNLKKHEDKSQLNKKMTSFRVIIKDAYNELYESTE